MGVIHKLKDEVVHFIISQRQSNPLFSCRQLAESASQKFGLNLSKSSVHDVLKESGIVTPRGRKPKDKFKIPQEKKKQIQVSLSQVKLLPSKIEPEVRLIPDVTETKDFVEELPKEVVAVPSKEIEISAEYAGAGRIFLKAALWDLGIFSEENIKQSDWDYYLTYVKGIKVILEDDKDFFIDLPLPIERCIRETADGLINNVKPLMVCKVSDETLFNASMNAQAGAKIKKISIVGQNDHVILDFDDIMEIKRDFIVNKRIFVESIEKDGLQRAKELFLPQNIDNNGLVEEILNLKGSNAISKDENVVSLFIEAGYNNGAALQNAVEKLNEMCLRDEQGRLVSVKILSLPG